jgi:branched-chain amino acid transport system permease protein
MGKPVQRIPGTAQMVAGLGFVIVPILVSGLLDKGYWHHNFLLLALFVAVAVLQNMLLADAGQVSFGQGAIFGIAAYATGIALDSLGVGLLVGSLIGIGCALLLGLAYALPSLRVQGYYLGFVSLSAAVVFPELLVALDSVTKGINGITIKPTALSEPALGALSPLSLIILVFACLVIAGHWLLRGAPLGRRMRVAATSPEAAQTLGISPGRMRFIAFLTAALGTGVAGVLYTPLLGFVSPYAFRVDLSIYFFFAVIVGGSGRLLGPVIGAWLLYLLPNVFLVELADYRLLAYGVIALLIMLAFPDGVVGTLERAFRRRGATQGGGTIGVGALMRSEGAGAGLAARADGRPPIEIRDATKRFGSVAALQDVSLTVGRGTVHGIVGPNGSGKTTLLNAMSGLIRLDGGSIRVNGHDTAGVAPHRLPALGLSRSFQTPRIFDSLSIWQNVEIGAASADGAHGRNAVLDALGAERPAWQARSPETLQHAQRRLLELLRAAAMGGDIILLDEPAAGLAPDERNALAALLVHLRDSLGKTIVLIEHDLTLVWRVADWISVLDAGVLVADGRPAEIRRDPSVLGLFTGGQDA